MRSLAAGCTVFANESGRVLLIRRSVHVPKPLLWSVPAGSVDDGESELFAALRELDEETGYSGDIRVLAHHQTREFCNFICRVKREFEPKLNWENDDWGWFDRADLPSPTFPGLKSFLKRVMSW